MSVSGILFLLYVFGNKKDPISVCVLHSYANYLRGQSKNSCTTKFRNWNWEWESA